MNNQNQSQQGSGGASGYTEPEERGQDAQKAEIIPDNDMLTGEEIIDRPHARPGTSGETVKEWAPPAYDASKEVEKEPSGTGEDENRPTGEFANKDLYDLPEDEKLESAAGMADFALAAYGETKREIGNAFVPIKRRRLNRLEEKGLINLDIPLPARGGGTINAEEHIIRYNERATDIFGLREKFVEEVRPILIKEFSKKGIGLTPMQRILVAVGLDLREDIKIAMSLKATGNEIIDALKSATAAYNQMGGADTFTQPIAAARPAQQQPAPMSHAAAENYASSGNNVSPGGSAYPGSQQGGGYVQTPAHPGARADQPVEIFSASATDQFEMMQQGIKSPLPTGAVPHVHQDIIQLAHKRVKPRKKSTKKKKVVSKL